MAGGRVGRTDSAGRTTLEEPVPPTWPAADKCSICPTGGRCRTLQDGTHPVKMATDMGRAPAPSNRMPVAVA